MFGTLVKKLAVKPAPVVDRIGGYDVYVKPAKTPGKTVPFTTLEAAAHFAVQMRLAGNAIAVTRRN